MNCRSIASALPALFATILLAASPAAGAPARPDTSEAPPPASEQGAPAAEKEQGDAASADTLAVPRGLQVFLDQKCSMCHTAYALGVGEAPEGWTPASSPGLGEPSSGPPDLSILPAAWTAELLKEYLVDRVEVGGAKHVTGFRGSDEDWAALVEWILPAPPDTAEGDH